jgi:NADP-dependent 3-hydroxy acid dehydrogenase YdfG
MRSIMSGSMEGRRVLITGGSAGIGAATAELCVREGARVACVGRNADRVQEIGARLGVEAIAADVRDPQAIGEAVDQAAETFGGLDALINSAGAFRQGLVSETHFEDWRAMFESNVLGLLSTTQAAMPYLKEAERADIVNISSMGGRRIDRPNSAIYSGTKFAVHALTEGLRRELFEHGVRVAVVAPGSVDTELGLSETTEAHADALRKRRAEFGLSAMEVANQVLFVLSQPPSVAIHEIALTSSSQAPS